MSGPLLPAADPFFQRPEARRPVARRRERTNPFYALLIAAGVIFTLTASAYGVMMLKAIRTLSPADLEQDSGLLGFMDRHGLKVMSVELGLLALATCGVIGTDRYWSPPPRAPQPEDDR